MSESRVSRYQDYRQSIAKSGDAIPATKSVKEDVPNSIELGYYKKIVIKNRVITLSIVLAIVLIITLLVVFGIKVF